MDTAIVQSARMLPRSHVCRNVELWPTIGDQTLTMTGPLN